MKTAKPTILLTICLLLPPLRNLHSESAKRVKKLTLAHCLSIAIAERPELRTKKARVDASAARIHEVRSEYFPSLKLNAGYERHKYNFNPKGGRPDGTARNAWVLGSSLSWSIPAMIATGSRVRSAGSRHSSEKFNMKAARRVVTLEVTLAYYKTQETKKYIELLEADLERARIHKKYAHVLLEVGKGSQADILRAETAMARTRLEITRARSGHLQALAALKTAMGLDVKESIALAEVTMKVPDDLFKPLKTRRRPEQVSIRHVLKAQKHVRQAALHDFWPDLKLYGGIELHDDIFFPKETNWFIGLSLEIPVFGYYGKTSRWMQRRAEVEEAKAIVKETDARTAIELETAFLQLKEAEAALEAAEALKASAKKNLEIDEKSYREGAGSMVALTDARAAYSMAKAEVVSAVFNAFVKAAEYRFAAGKDMEP